MFQKFQSLPDCEIKFNGAESGRFAGYASKFGSVDSVGDTILKGAYVNTLREFGNPKMYVQHNASGLPVGKYTRAVEDETGLYVEGEFTPGNARADEARAALKHGTVDGLSIGFMLKKADYNEREDGVRVIKNVSKLVEVSIVTFPADTAARIDLASVKFDEVNELETVRDFARYLRDAGNFSKALADAMVSRLKVIVLQGEPATADTEAKAAKQILDELHAFTERMRQR